jgi:hypothetical protein
VVERVRVEIRGMREGERRPRRRERRVAEAVDRVKIRARCCSDLETGIGFSKAGFLMKELSRSVRVDDSSDSESESDVEFVREEESDSSVDEWFVSMTP